jgi:hypothetical protein
LLQPDLLPEQLRIGKNTPSERDPLARSDFQKNRSSGVLRKHLKLWRNAGLLGFDVAMLAFKLG